MPVLLLIGAIVGIDIGAKLLGKDTITAVLRRNKAEAGVGLVWLAIHVFRRDP